MKDKIIKYILSGIVSGIFFFLACWTKQIGCVFFGVILSTWLINPSVLTEKVKFPHTSIRDVIILIAFILFIAAFLLFIHEIGNVEAFKIASTNWKVVLLLWLALMVEKLRIFSPKKGNEVS